MPSFTDLQALVAPCLWLAFVGLVVFMVLLVREDIVLGSTARQYRKQCEAITARYQDLTDHVFKVKEVKEVAKAEGSKL